MSDDTPYETLDDLAPPAAAAAPSVSPPTVPPVAEPEVVVQRYIDPETGETRDTKVRILRRAVRRPPQQ